MPSYTVICLLKSSWSTCCRSSSACCSGFAVGTASLAIWANGMRLFGITTTDRLGPGPRPRRARLFLDDMMAANLRGRCRNGPWDLRPVQHPARPFSAGDNGGLTRGTAAGPTRSSAVPKGKLFRCCVTGPTAQGRQAANPAMHAIHGDLARAQIANSCNILILYKIRNLKSYCRSVLVFNRLGQKSHNPAGPDPG